MMLADEQTRRKTIRYCFKHDPVVRNLLDTEELFFQNAGAVEYVYRIVTRETYFGSFWRYRRYTYPRRIKKKN